MGSGLYPDGNYQHTGVILNVEYRNHSYMPGNPSDWRFSFEKLIDNTNCFGLVDHGYQGHQGFSFKFGGPGGQCGNKNMGNVYYTPFMSTIT